MHSVYDDIQVCAGDDVHQLVEIHVQLQLDLLLVFTSMIVPNGWDHIRAHNDIPTPEYPCIRSIALLTLSTPC